MRLDRNINDDGKGKYALVLMRKVEAGSEAAALLARLAEMGVVDWGARHSDSEFFLLRLKDKYAEPALMAYANAAADDDKQWATEVLAMATRAANHPNKKTPD